MQKRREEVEDDNIDDKAYSPQTTVHNLSKNKEKVSSSPTASKVGEYWEKG